MEPPIRRPSIAHQSTLLSFSFLESFLCSSWRGAFAVGRCDEGRHLCSSVPLKEKYDALSVVASLLGYWGLLYAENKGSEGFDYYHIIVAASIPSGFYRVAATCLTTQ